MNDLDFIMENQMVIMSALASLVTDPDEIRNLDTYIIAIDQRLAKKKERATANQK